MLKTEFHTRASTLAVQYQTTHSGSQRLGTAALRDRPDDLWKAHFCHLCLVLSITAKFMTIGEGRHVDQLVN